MLNVSAPAPEHITLRPYQLTCVERAIDAFQLRPKGGRALIILPTGGGKTLVFAEIARRLGLSTLIIAHRQELLQQAAEKFHLIDPTASIGQVGAGKYEWGTPITVASVQTISRRKHLDVLRQFSYDLVIIDECHHSPASGYQAVLDVLPDAFVLGVTATSDRLDKLSVEHIFGDPIFKTSIIDLVRQGYLSNIRAIAIPTTTSLDDLHTQAGDFQVDELAVLVDTPERNERIATSYLQHCSGRQALCFAVTVAHAEHLAEAFQDAGVRAAMVCGETPSEKRKDLLSAYEQGTLNILCNVGVLTEGYDAPATSCIIMTRPTKSRALYVQSIGRGTRLAPGKLDCIILDISDNTLKHRLEPLSLCKALEQELRDGESILEAEERAEQERAAAAYAAALAAEREQAEDRDRRRIRQPRVPKREQDLEIDLFEQLDWQPMPNGGYSLEIGEHKYRIVLIPSNCTAGYYSVWARLPSSKNAQLWLAESPLKEALRHAEMKAKLIRADEKKLVLVDNNAPWRARPVTYKQIYKLRQLGVPFHKKMTCGEAADLIERALG